MNIAREDITAARTPSQTSRYQPGYDCPLPNDALSELLGKRLPQILGKPPSPPQRPSWLDYARSWGNAALLGLCGLLFIVALGAVYSWFANQPAKRQPVPAPPPVVQPAPATLSPPSTPIVAPIQPIPRAMLVRLPAPPPRAQLVRLPAPDNTEIAPRNIGQTHTIMMPYGTVVRATLRGFLGAEDQLPRVGQIGDMYLVEQTPWIWIQVPGTTAPTWVDP